MPEQAAGQPSPMRSLERALDVIAVLQEHRAAMRLTDVARESGLHVAPLNGF